VRNFIADLDAGPLDCARAIPRIKPLRAFASQLSEVRPANAEEAGASEDELRMAAVSAYAVSDVIHRWFTDWEGKGMGLRGGTWRYESDGDDLRFSLNGIRWTMDTAVSGSARRYRDGEVTASVKIDGPRQMHGELELNWNDRRPDFPARIVGTIGGRQIDATMPAP
jgi:hypothetical protein